MTRIALFVFIDAFGWDILRRVHFLEDVAPHRRELLTTFGYSSAAVPSILTGRMPAENGHWSCFFYSPETSPFRRLPWLRVLQLLPRSISSRSRFRHLVSGLLRRSLGFQGYFQIYNVPFRHLHLFDYSEKKDMFVPGGINAGRSIFDDVEDVGVPAHVSDWRLSEEQNLAAAERALATGLPRFAFVYQGGFDALLHVRGTRHPEVERKVAWYDTRVRRLLDTAADAYEVVDLHVFSDHGQADVTDVHDLMDEVEGLGLRFGTDYVAMYDSTMFRCWFQTAEAERRIRGLLAGLAYGRVLQPADLRQLGAALPRRLTGDLVFLLQEGHILAPSFMGEKPVPGMHGYHPLDPSSYGMLVSNRPVDQVLTIRDMYRVMHDAVLEAGAT